MAEATMRLETRSEVLDVPPPHRVTVDHAPRCWRCDRVLLTKAARPWSKKCDKCGAHNNSVPSVL